MIPTNTLRERMREAVFNAACSIEDRLHEELRLVAELQTNGCDRDETISRVIQAVAVSKEIIQAAIDAIGDPVLIKTADSLEPTFTLRAQDKAADGALYRWTVNAEANGCSSEKLDDADRHATAFRAWPTRKWPD